MIEESKKVCVFIPCYNSEKYIEKTMASLLNQTFRDFDIVIVDDGSEDASLDIINRIASDNPNIIVYKNENNMGLGMTRNMMFDYCKDYKYVALIDADDIAPYNRLELEYNYMEENRDVSCVSGIMQIIDQNDKLGQVIDDGIHNYEDIKRVLNFKNTISNGSSMFRMSDLLANNIKYRNHFFCAQDYMFYCELVQRCKIVKIPYILLYYRRHENNISKTSVKRKKERDRLLDEIHDFTFGNGKMSLNFIEKAILKRGYRDTGGESVLFKLVFIVIKHIFKKKNPEYRGLI